MITIRRRRSILYSFSVTFIILLHLRQCKQYNLSELNDESAQDLHEKWHQFKTVHQKLYSKRHKEERSRQTWSENYNKILRHNEEADKGFHTYKLRDNFLADLTPAQYARLMVKLTKSNRRKLAISDEFVASTHLLDEYAPEEMDWRKEGFVTPPVNQLTCGSCYAFSIVYTVQGQIFKQTGDLETLSEQQIIDCSTRMGNYGCGGGSLRNTLRYLEKSGGLMSYKDYPYNAKQNKCLYDQHKAIVNITSWAILPSKDELALERAVANIGPIAVSINASPETFQLYSSEGIYDDRNCSSKHVNHAMLLVGYTKDYWVLKNWWGNNWGEEGYMKLRRDQNRCGVANYAAYSVLR